LRLCPFADEILASYPLSQIDTLKADVTLTGMTAMEKIGKDRKDRKTAMEMPMKIQCIQSLSQ
jgi:hypothetical protein